MDDDWPEDSLPADAVPPCWLCDGLMMWQSWTGQWHCLRCNPPLEAARFWSYQKRQAVAPVVELVRRDAWFAAQNERLLLFPEEAM